MLWLPRLERELIDWGFRNFGEQQPWEKLLGLAEEYGEACEGMANRDRYLDAIGDSAIFLIHYCVLKGWSPLEIFSMAGHINRPTGRPWPEQLGRLCHHELKAHQRVRGGMREHDRAGRRAAAILVRYWCEELGRMGTDIETVVSSTWAEVSQRDWTRDEARRSSRPQACEHRDFYGDREYGTTFCGVCHAEVPSPGKSSSR